MPRATLAMPRAASAPSIKSARAARDVARRQSRAASLPSKRHSSGGRRDSRAGSTALPRKSWLDRCVANADSSGTPATSMVQLYSQSAAVAAADVSSHRDLDTVEFFSGVGSIVEAARLKGLAAQGYDKQREPGVTDKPGPRCEDITTEAGFLNAVRLLQRIRPGGLAWFAPMCNSFNWLCRHQSARQQHNQWVGDETRAFVATGNQAAAACDFLISVACLRGLEFVLENPPRSLMWPYLAAHGANRHWRHTATCDRCAFSIPPPLARPGMPAVIAKQYSFVGNAQWVAALGKRCRCPPGTQHTTMTKTVGKKRWGRAALMRASASYPLSMGVAVVAEWGRSRQSGIGSTSCCDIDDDEGCPLLAANAGLGEDGVSDASLLSSASSLSFSRDDDIESDPGLLSD